MTSKPIIKSRDSWTKADWFRNILRNPEPSQIWRSLDPWLSHSQSEQKTWWSWTRPRIQISRSSNLKRKTNSLRNLVPFSFSFCQGKFQRFPKFRWPESEYIITTWSPDSVLSRFSLTRTDFGQVIEVTTVKNGRYSNMTIGYIKMTVVL